MEYKQTRISDYGENSNFERYRIIYESDQNYDVPQVIKDLDENKIKIIRALDTNEDRQMSDKVYTDVKTFLDNYEDDKFMADDEVVYDVDINSNGYDSRLVLINDSKKIVAYTDDQFFDLGGMFTEKESSFTK